MAEKPKQLSIIPDQGQRALVIGKTGSGKTNLAKWILKRADFRPFVIYDTKIENGFLSLPNSVLAETQEQVDEAIQDEDIDFVIYRPDPAIVVDPLALDELLQHHYDHYSSVGAYIDEIYQFHNNARPGPGLLGLLTRGRSRKITLIMSSQRPSYFSRFVLTESERFYIMELLDKQDAKRLSDVIPDFEKLEKPVKYGFWYFDAGSDQAIRYKPITLEKEKPQPQEKPIGETPALPETPLEKIRWI